jgi:hypothetical protein
MKLLKLCFVLSAALLFSSYSFGCIGRKVFRSTDSKKESKQNEPQPTQLSSSEEIEKRIDLLKRVWPKCFGDRRYLEEELALLEAQLAEAKQKEENERMRKAMPTPVDCPSSWAPWNIADANKF